MLVQVLLKNASQYICLVLWLLPLLFVKFSEILKSKMGELEDNYNKNIKKGKDNFQRLLAIKEKNKSPSPNIKLTKEEIKLKIEFCEHELKIHKENLNNNMIGFKTAEIKDLEKKL